MEAEYEKKTVFIVPCTLDQVLRRLEKSGVSSAASEILALHADVTAHRNNQALMTERIQEMARHMVSLEDDLKHLREKYVRETNEQLDEIESLKNRLARRKEK